VRGEGPTPSSRKHPRHKLVADIDRHLWLAESYRAPKTGRIATPGNCAIEDTCARDFQGDSPLALVAGRPGLYLKRNFDMQSTANGQSDLRKDSREALGILMAISGIVLLIACANVANLMLARGVSREREVAIWIALGSSKGRLVRQLLTESLLVSSVGTTLGVLFARWGVPLLVRFLDVFLALAPDARVLAFNAGVATVTGLLAPALPARVSNRSKR